MVNPGFKPVIRIFFIKKGTLPSGSLGSYFFCSYFFCSAESSSRTPCAPISGPFTGSSASFV